MQLPTQHELELKANLRALRCLADRPLPETVALVRLSIIVHDAAIGLVIGFMFAAWWMS